MIDKKIIDELKEQAATIGIISSDEMIKRHGSLKKYLKWVEDYYNNIEQGEVVTLGKENK